MGWQYCKQQLNTLYQMLNTAEVMVQGKDLVDGGFPFPSLFGSISSKVVSKHSPQQARPPDNTLLCLGWTRPTDSHGETLGDVRGRVTRS